MPWPWGELVHRGVTPLTPALPIVGLATGEELAEQFQRAWSTVSPLAVSPLHRGDRECPQDRSGPALSSRPSRIRLGRGPRQGRRAAGFRDAQERRGDGGRRRRDGRHGGREREGVGTREAIRRERIVRKGGGRLSVCCRRRCRRWAALVPPSRPDPIASIFPVHPIASLPPLRGLSPPASI